MKKLFALLAVIGILTFAVSTTIKAQPDTDPATEQQVSQGGDESPAPQTGQADDEDAGTATNTEDDEGESKALHKRVKEKFVEGGATFMGFILMCLILGLALAIERIIYLNLATTNTDKLLVRVEEALEDGGVEAAKEVCRNTRGPVASIFYQGLDRTSEGIEMVEKSVVSYGSVQMGLLEKNLSWISLFISIAPMLGFMGTVLGMIQAFDEIAAAGDVSPQIVAGPIGVALITTVSGLIVAVVLQLFYNYILSKIDGIVNSMEDASISLVDILVKHNIKK